MKSKLIKITKNEVIKVKENTQYVLVVRDYFNEKRDTLEFIFETSGISAEILLMYFLPAKGKLKVTTISNHKAPNTSCLTKVRGVLSNYSTSEFIGKINIDRVAQQTSSFLEDRVLVVGKNTKNNSQPILSIEADDVHASHSATTGRVDDEQLYYLMSRGLTKKESTDIIVQGFFTEMLEQIQDEKIRLSVLTNLKRIKL